MTWDSHPLRERIVAEMHMRRMPPLAAPVMLAQTVRLVAPEARDAERAHVAAMPDVLEQDHHLRPRDAMGRTGRGVELLWERHNEASTTTVISASHDAAPFEAPLEAEAALRWLEAAPGSIVRATRIAIVADETAAEATLARLGLPAGELVSCRLGTARLWSDFQLHADGYGRLLIAAGDVPAADLGRLVQRVQELGNYRNMALLGLPLVQSQGEQLAALEAALAGIAERMGKAGNAATLLNELCDLSAEVAAITTATGFRMSATAAYAQIAVDRLASLDCVDVAGFQSLTDFTDRRLLPAVRTCASFVNRLETLSVRIERATSLLRTRVDLAMQAQNVELLRSMDANATQQLRLQHLVEGLSVVAISYYALNLLSHFFPVLARWTGIAEARMDAVAVVPVIVLVALFLRWRTRDAIKP